MQRFKSSLASVVALVLFFWASSALFAQTETQTAVAVEVENKTQSAETANKTTPEVDKEADTAVAEDTSVASEDETKDEGPSEDTIQKTDEPRTEPPKPQPAAARANPGRFALTFDDLKFDMEKTETFDRNMLTSKINSYHGGKVKIRGYIRPNFKQSGITKFIFVRDNKECCFGPQAAIFDNILVRLEQGSSTNYTVRPVTIEGDFVLKEYHGDDGNVWSLYRMYNAKVK